MELVPPTGGRDQEIKVLKEMKEHQEFENDNRSKGVCEVAAGQSRTDVVSKRLFAFSADSAYFSAAGNSC